MKEHTKAYVAGLIDAEGSLSIEERPHFDCVTSAARVSFSNTDRRIHKYLVKMFGGQFSKINREGSDRPEHWKIEYQWSTTGAKHSLWFLSQILPYLIIKRREAELLIEYYSLNGIQSEINNRRRKELIIKSRELKDRSVETEIQKFSGKSNLINAYLAGLMDGDGCITIQKNPIRNGNGYFVYAGQLSIVNTFASVVLEIENVLGGRSSLRTEETENRMASYQWQQRKKPSIESTLLKVMPYLVIKKEQAKLLLEFVRRPRIEKKDINPDRHDFREDFYQKMQSLNHPENQDTAQSYE
ncbi:MAG: hypothetical protein ACREQ5_08665 [Candidatus Dormibacteria bacterium]